MATTPVQIIHVPFNSLWSFTDGFMNGINAFHTHFSFVFNGHSLNWFVLSHCFNDTSSNIISSLNIAAAPSPAFCPSASVIRCCVRRQQSARLSQRSQCRTKDRRTEQWTGEWVDGWMDEQTDTNFNFNFIPFFLLNILIINYIAYEIDFGFDSFIFRFT